MAEQKTPPLSLPPPDANKQQAPAHPRKMSAKRKRVLTIIGAIFIIIAIIWFLYWLIWGRFEEYTDDAYVNGNLVRLMPQVAGTVIGINTDDTQLVTEGQTLVKLDEADMRLALDHAQANLANTVRTIRKLYDNVREAHDAVTLRAADLDNAKDDLTRRRGLVGDRAISREELQHYQTAVATAQASYDLAQSQLSAAIAQVQNTDLYNHPEVQRAKANLKNAYLNFYRTTIISPVTGYVAKRSVQVGQQVTPGTSMMSIVPLNQVWIDANYKESQLGRLRIGQKVTLKVDAYGGKVFHGTVLGLSAGTGSAFDLLPPQNATGNWIKIVQRLPVRIIVDMDELKKYPLRIGLSVRVTTNTFSQSGDILSKTAKDTPLYTTDVYANELNEVDKIIAEIIQANAPDISLTDIVT